MKDLIILALAAMVLFFVWNGRRAAPYAAGDINLTAPVQPTIVQAIIEKVQSMKPDLAPIDTVYVNVQPDGSYNSRFMFYNTKQFFGAQYDVSASVGQDGSVNILKIGDSASIDPTYGYKPDMYQPWVDVQKNLDSQFANALKGYTPLSYKDGSLDTQTNLMTRS